MYDFISEVIMYHPDGSKETILKREPVYPGLCIMHKPKLGPTLPVYVPDKYEEFSDPQPMINLDDWVIGEYIQANADVLTRIIDEYEVEVIHANHAVLMSVVAQRVGMAHNIPYAIMPHGSAIEFAVKKDKRFYQLAVSAFEDAQRIYVIGKEIRDRVKRLFPGLSGLESKMKELNLGVDTSLFNPIKREERKEKINGLYALLKNVERGKTGQQSHQMLNSLHDSISRQELLGIINTAANYNGKRTDEKVEEKLHTIDWGRVKLILFVGRLIASKGLHSVIAALPEILADEPNTHLIVVGHGPQREPLEALIWAMQNNHTELVFRIVQWGSELESNGEGPWEEMQLYFDQLQKANELDEYFQKAQKYLRKNTILFTGYLTHRELCYLFPACDVAIFPSVVAEAGPLVFLEAMASGCFPVGTYFAGMAASIDSVSDALPREIVDLMKLSPDADQTVRDIISKVTQALYVEGNHKEKLREVAVEKYDWQNISKKLASDLTQLQQ